MNLLQARQNMVAQQIRAWNVLTMSTLNAIESLPREDFVPTNQQHLAYGDLQIPLGHGEVMLEPKVIARMIETLELTGHEKVLEIGTGSGYGTALLSLLSSHVTSVDIHADFIESAQQNLTAANIDNVTLACGDAHQGWGEDKYDAILVSGSMPEFDVNLLDNLKPEGCIVAILGDAPAMAATRITQDDGTPKLTSVFDTVVPRLANVIDKAQFVF